MKCRLILFLIFSLLLVGTVSAVGVKQGDNEVTFSASWDQINYDAGDDESVFTLRGSVGHFFSDNLQAGVMGEGEWNDGSNYGIGIFGKWHFNPQANMVGYAGGFAEYLDFETNGYVWGPLVGAKFWVGGLTNNNIFLFAEYQYRMYNGDLGDFLDAGHTIFGGFGMLLP